MPLQLEALLSGKPLGSQDTQEIFELMLSGQLSDVQIGAVLAAWRLRGEGATELHAGALALRCQATAVPVAATLRPLLDNCGTGGDSSHSFNLSTAAAIVAASAGARVAKHGNRSVSSKCGSADLLFAAGLPATLSPELAAELLARTGFTFFFAPAYHPALARVATARKQLGVRTVFNLLGPLANPIAPDVQLIGVGAAVYLQPMAEALRRLGCQKALVVHARDGLDELSPAAVTDALLVEGGKLTPLTFDPVALGAPASLAELAGGDAAVNLGILQALLDDRAPGVAAAVALNAGVALWLYGIAATPAAGVALARRQISSKVARDYFTSWLALAQSLAS